MRTWNRRTVVALLAALLPAAHAVSADDTLMHRSLELRADAGWTVPISVTWPANAESLPVIVFSHGAFSAGDAYPLLTDAWASHGYLVVAPTHPDSTTRDGRRGVPTDPGWWQRRLDEMHLVLGQLPALGERIPELEGHVDATRIAVAGHSFGGMVAQTIAGATWFDPQAGKTVSSAYPGVRAVIIVSGAGRLPPLLRQEDWQSLAVPTLVSVGTDDLKQTDISGYAWRREPWDFAPPGHKFLLTLEDADHYLGGMVGRDDLERSPAGERYVDALVRVSTTFLDAWVRDDAAARKALEQAAASEHLEGEPLARLEVK